MKAATANTSARITGNYSRDFDQPVSGMLGLGSLFDLLAQEGFSIETVLAGTGLTAEDLVNSKTGISQNQKIAIFDNIRRLEPSAGIALKAGQQLRFSDFGVYGYALLSCATVYEAIAFGVQHVRLAGPALAKEFRVEDGTAIFTAHDVLALGALLPLISEFWFAAIQSLVCKVSESPFHPTQLFLPYAKPHHAGLYEQVFGCPVHFSAPVMEMHFDAAVLSLPLPNANPVTAELCAGFCQRMLRTLDDMPEADILMHIRQQLLKTPGSYPSLQDMADRLNMTERTLQRHLAQSGTQYRQVLDDMRQRLAEEYLRHTDLSVEVIASHIGFSDAANFRKAFKKWTGQPPSFYRQ